MRKIALAFTLLSTTLYIKAQDITPKQDTVTGIWSIAEQYPSFPGGYDSLKRFIAMNLKYPESARRMKVEGRVYVKFVIDVDGKVYDTSVLKGISVDTDKEALRVIQMMPKWIPGMVDGKPVRVSMVYPINFML